MNLADFYREEDKNQLQQPQIQSRKLYIDDEDDQMALESQNSLSLDNFDSFLTNDGDLKVDLVKQDVDKDTSKENIIAASTLDDQIAMESVNQHLKKMSQIPSGLKKSLHTDLIRKLTTVVPEPKSKYCVLIVNFE